MARSERQEDGTRSGVGTLTKDGTRPPQAPGAGQTAPDPRRDRPGRPVPPQRPVPGPQAAGAAAHGVERRDRVPSQRPVPIRSGAQRPVGEQRLSAGRSGGVQRGDAPQPASAPPRPGLRRRASATGPQPAVAPGQVQGPQTQPETVQPGKTHAPAGSHRMPFVLLLCGLLGGALVSALVITTTLAEGSFEISKLQGSTSSLAKQQQTLQEEVAQAESPQQIAQRASQLGMRRTTELQFIDLKTGKTTNDGPTWSGAVDAPGYTP